MKLTKFDYTANDETSDNDSRITIILTEKNQNVVQV